MRGSGTRYDLSIASDDVLRIPGNGTLGFHPAFIPLADLCMEGRMVIVQNVGYPNQDLSHFRSTDTFAISPPAPIFTPSAAAP